MARPSIFALGLLAAGCDRELSLGELRAVVEDAGASDGAIAFSCTQRGPLEPVGDGAQGACGASSAGFHYALCSCDAIQDSQRITVDGFDSTKAAYAPGAASGSLAMNGALYGVAVTLGGSLRVAGSDGAPLGGDVNVGGHLVDRGQLQGQHAVSVGGDARIAGDVRVTRLTVAGTLTLAPSSALEVTAGAPSAARATLAIDPPCSCAPGFDIAARVAAAKVDNDNLTQAIDPPNSLRTFTAPLERTLPCGRYFVTDIYGARPITLRITGRVALYVENRIVIERDAGLTIALADDAELDLYVAHDISALGPVDIGAPSAPTRARLHFGNGTLNFGANARIAASLYAPNSELVPKGSFELYGAALVARVAADSQLALHYDRALSGDACAAASCQQPRDCGDLLRCDGARCLP